MNAPLPPVAETKNRSREASPAAMTEEQHATSSLTLWINEVFHSIQGEGLDVGRPCLFVRLAGCNLRCSYCDTPYAWERDGARRIKIDDLVGSLAQYGTQLVEITGGEPLLQPGVMPLMRRLIERGYRVILETSGQRDASAVPEEVVRIIDVKTPGSMMAGVNYLVNLTSLRPTDQIKFVIMNRSDYEWAKRRLIEHDLVNRVAAVFFSPAHGELPPRTLAEWILQDRLAVRMHLQMHKYIWGAGERGV